MDIKRTKRIIDYMESSVQDNTAHSQMDKLLLDNEINNQPSYPNYSL